MRRTTWACDAPACGVTYTFEQAPGPRKVEHMAGWHLVTVGAANERIPPEEPYYACSLECAQRIAMIAAGSATMRLPCKITVEPLGYSS